MAVAGETKHRVVEVLDPAADGFAIAKLDGDNHLTVAEGAQIKRFLAGFAGRWCLGAAAGTQWWSHNSILDAKICTGGWAELPASSGKLFGRGIRIASRGQVKAPGRD